MIDKILDGISNKLYETFGDSHRIYSEVIPQNFAEPCFFIKVLNPSRTQRLGRHYQAVYPFDIHYFPEHQTEPNREMDEVAEGLYDALECISCGGDIVRGSDMNYEKQDGVLHFFIQYDLGLIKEEMPETRMEDITVKRRGRT